MSIGQRYGVTNTGKKRRRNEDAFVCEPPLFAIADGMGGAQAGEVASSLATAALSGALKEGDHVPPAAAELLVGQLIQEANRRVHDRATHDAAASGMGTTMTVALVGSGNSVAIGHVGDSRAYLVRDGILEQLTDDHSLVAELVRRGELSPEQAEVHPQRSVITRALGTDPEVDVDVFSIAARPGDIFLLCSDGLSTMVNADGIARTIISNRHDLEAATRGLIDAANRSGGEDNITAVLFEIGADETAGEQTVAIPAAEMAAYIAADDEDTLHPEDNVPVIPVPVIAAPLYQDDPAAAHTDDQRPPSAPRYLAEDTFVMGADEVRDMLYAPRAEHVPFARRLLAILVIVALAGLAIALAVWGLAR